jgi:hypothetical protein
MILPSSISSYYRVVYRQGFCIPASMILTNPRHGECTAAEADLNLRFVDRPVQAEHLVGNAFVLGSLS